MNLYDLYTDALEKRAVLSHMSPNDRVRVALHASKSFADVHNHQVGQYAALLKKHKQGSAEHTEATRQHGLHLGEVKQHEKHHARIAKGLATDQKSDGATQHAVTASEAYANKHLKGRIEFK